MDKLTTGLWLAAEIIVATLVVLLIDQQFLDALRALSPSASAKFLLIAPVVIQVGKALNKWRQSKE